MNTLLAIILIIGSASVIWWVLLGEKKNKEMLK